MDGRCAAQDGKFSREDGGCAAQDAMNTAVFQTKMGESGEWAKALQFHAERAAKSSEHPYSLL